MLESYSIAGISITQDIRSTTKISYCSYLGYHLSKSKPIEIVLLIFILRKNEFLVQK